MARLPSPGGDQGNWGNILNDFLSQELFNDTNNPSHPDNGKLKIRLNGTLSNYATTDYVDSTVASAAPDASSSVKGLVQLTGHLGGTASNPTVPALANKVDTSALPNMSAANIYSASAYSSIQAAIDAAQTAGGGVVVVAPGTYDQQINITSAAPVQVIGYGATLRATANSQNVVRISQDVGTASHGSRVSGFKIRPNGFSGVIGIEIADTDRAILSDLHIQDCSVGIRFHSEVSGKWVEHCAVYDSYIYNCTTGIEYKITNGDASFNETALINVGVSTCDTGILQPATANFSRVTWTNVTIWIVANQTGVVFNGTLDYSRLKFGVEAFSSTGTTGISLGSTFNYFAAPYSHDISISFVGSFANKVIDSSSSAGLIWSDGVEHYTTDYAPVISGWKYGESNPRFRLGTSGLAMGAGDANPIPVLNAWYGSFFQSSGNHLFQSNIGLPNIAANGGAASKASRIYGTADSWAGYIPIYDDPGGPAQKPSNTQTSSYTLALTDAGKAVVMNGASANNLTVPPNSSAAFPIGTTITIEQYGAGQTTIAAGVGVTLRNRAGLKLTGQYAVATLRKIGTDEWLASGDLSA